MTKRIDKVLSAFMILVLTLCCFAVPSYAAEISNDEGATEDISSIENWVLTENETYGLDDGWTVTVKGYMSDKNSEDGISSQSANSGSDTYKCYCKFTRSAVGQSWDWLEMWVWGTFDWNTDNDTVYVRNSGSDRNILHSHPTIVSDTNTDARDYEGGNFLGKRCGSVSRTIVMHNGSGMNQTFKLSVDVNVKGKVHFSPSDAVLT